MARRQKEVDEVQAAVASTQTSIAEREKHAKKCKRQKPEDAESKKQRTDNQPPEPEKHHLRLAIATEEVRMELGKFGSENSWTTEEIAAVTKGVRSEAASAEVVTCFRTRQAGWRRSLLEKQKDRLDLFTVEAWQPEDLADAPPDGTVWNSTEGAQMEVCGYECASIFRSAEVRLRMSVSRFVDTEDSEFGPDEHLVSGIIHFRRSKRLSATRIDGWTPLCRWDFHTGFNNGDANLMQRGSFDAEAAAALASLVAGAEGSSAWRLPFDVLQLVWRLCGAPSKWLESRETLVVRRVDEDVDSHDEGDYEDGDELDPSLFGLLRVHLLDLASRGAGIVPGHLSAHLVGAATNRTFNDDDEDDSGLRVDPFASDIGIAVARSCENPNGRDGHWGAVHRFPGDVDERQAEFEPPTLRRRNPWEDTAREAGN